VSVGGRPLPDSVRGQMESAFRADFRGVRIHIGPQAERIGALAFTMGNDIYFAPDSGRDHAKTYAAHERERGPRNTASAFERQTPVFPDVGPGNQASRVMWPGRSHTAGSVLDVRAWP
jgi:hypothetical protein